MAKTGPRGVVVRRLLLLGVLLAGPLACAPTVTTHGYLLDEADVARIEPGRTSQNQVLDLLGSPSSASTFDGTVWYYVSRRTAQKSFYDADVVAQKVVAISFDADGVVRSVERHDLADAREVQLVERETPTEGNEFTVLEQFIGNLGRFNLPRDEQRR